MHCPHRWIDYMLYVRQLPTGLMSWHAIVPRAQLRHNVSLSGYLTGHWRRVSHQRPSDPSAAPLPLRVKKTWRQKTGQRTEVYVMSRWCWFSAWWYHNDSNIPRKCKSNCLFSSCVNGNYIFIASKLVSKLQQWCRRDEVVEIKCRTNLNNSLLHSYLNHCSHENRFNDLNTALRMRTGSDGSD